MRRHCDYCWIRQQRLIVQIVSPHLQRVLTWRQGQRVQRIDIRGRTYSRETPLGTVYHEVGARGIESLSNRCCNGHSSGHSLPRTRIGEGDRVRTGGRCRCWTGRNWRRNWRTGAVCHGYLHRGRQVYVIRRVVGPYLQRVCTVRKCGRVQRVDIGRLAHPRRSDLRAVNHQVGTSGVQIHIDLRRHRYGPGQGRPAGRGRDRHQA